MPAPDQPEVQHACYALGWIHETYRGHPVLVHNGSIDGFTVHLGFIPETGQGLIILMNRDLATAALMALAYSAYDRLLGLAPLDWEGRLKESTTQQQEIRRIALDFPLNEVVGRYEHPAYGVLTVRAQGNRLALQFRTLHFTLAYQGRRRFLSLEPIADGAPRISVQFSKRKRGEPVKLTVPLNFDAGDPVEVFTRADQFGGGGLSQGYGATSVPVQHGVLLSSVWQAAVQMGTMLFRPWVLHSRWQTGPMVVLSYPVTPTASVLVTLLSEVLRTHTPGAGVSPPGQAVMTAGTAADMLFASPAVPVQEQVKLPHRTSSRSRLSLGNPLGVRRHCKTVGTSLGMPYPT
jgi:hypothetical protein